MKGGGGGRRRRREFAFALTWKRRRRGPFMAEKMPSSKLMQE